MTYIAKVYANLIRKGKKTVEQVRPELRDEVIALLETTEEKERADS